MEILYYNEDSSLYFNEEYIIKRECGKSPNGNNLNYKWVLRNSLTNNFIDFDIYRHDLAERNGLEIK